MSTCNIRIELAEPGTVQTGQWLRGNIIVEVSDDVKADAIMLELDLDTHGRCNHQTTVVQSLTLPGGQWSAGHQVRVPFEMQIPKAGPITYRGGLFNVDWRLRARVELPWKGDPQTAEDLMVVAGERTIPTGPSSVSASLPRGPSTVIGPGVSVLLAIILLPFFIVGLVFLVTGLKANTGLNTSSLDPGILVRTVVHIAFGAALVYGTAMAARYLLFKGLSSQAVDDASLTLSQRRVSPGQEIAAHLDLPLQVADQLQEVTAELVGEEAAGSGNDSYRWFVFARWPLSVHCREDGGHIRCEVSGKVRDRAVPTLWVHRNEVRWEVHVNVKLRDRPDITWKEELKVEPKRPG